MKKILISLLLVSSHLMILKSSDDVLIKIHDREISSDEFLRIYNKNNNNNTIDNKTIDEYLDLFINFKLKVIEAEELKYDTMPAFIEEFEKYRKQLVKPYLIDKDAEEKIIKDTYERMKWEVSASHILISVSAKASPEDTAAAYNKIMEIRSRILNGEDFNQVAKATSDDQSAKTNGGYLGYFTAFSMVYPFENGAFNTKVGEISMPVRTSFGYHLIKVNDKRPNRGEIKVAHIMKMTPRGSTKEFMDSMKVEIDKIYEKVKAGEDFAELATTNSDDKSSAVNGGELPWFSSTSRIIEDFVNACYTLKDKGDYTEPFQTDFGWHIVKKLDSREMKSYDELKDEIAEKIKRDPKRNKLSEDKAIEKLKNEYNFSQDISKLDYIKEIVNDNIFKKSWDSELCKKDEVIFTLDNVDYTQKDFADFIAENQKEAAPYDLNSYVTEKYKEFVNNEVLAYEESKLDEKYPDYKHLVQEYHDGILLFNLTDDMVWSKAVKDSAGLRAFHETVKNNYKWGERVSATIYSSDDPVKIKELRKILKSKEVKNAEAVEMVCDTINTECAKYERGVFEKGDNEIIDGVAWKISVSKPITKENKSYVIQIKELLPEEPKSFEDAAGLITSDYQNYLDKKWIEELRNKYKIEVNQELLSKLK